MRDRELLEAAAKAAGLNLDEFLRVAANWRWTPLTDDGDALRLAVKLRMSVCVEDDQTWICMQGAQTVPVCFENHGTNADAATRRAIVRAAAAMAK